jgi:K+-transporting ATPase ATPase C chain
MRSALRPAAVLLALLTLITGVAYPLLVTGVARVAFPWQAGGSVLTVSGEARGSALIGQEFHSPRYFWGRLSATSAEPYDASSSSGSNLGPTNPALAAAARARIAAMRAAGDAPAAVPVDLVTASASGLDPDISPAAARAQVARVARARGLAPELVLSLVAKHTQDRTFGLLGEPRVNVLELNLALDGAAPGR